MKNEIISTPVRIAKGAVDEIKKLMNSDNFNPEFFLRLGVKSGGCSGFEYIIGFDDKKEGDEEYIVEGIPVLIQQSHLMYLEGIELDYSTGLNNRGFLFNNPNAKETCGCGSSFSA